MAGSPPPFASRPPRPFRNAVPKPVCVAAGLGPNSRSPFQNLPRIALLTGKAYSLSHGIDPISGEELTNFYYYEHAPVHEVVVTVVERFPDRAHLRLEGITPDPVVYDGSAPPAKIVIDGVFTLVFNHS